MKLSDMTDPEKRALATLVRRMVGADGVTSGEETAGLQQAADDLGAEEFWSLVRESAGDDDPDEVIDARARAVDRRVAQERIYGVLFGIAAAGSIMAGEDSLLSRVADIWDIEAPVPPSRN